MPRPQPAPMTAEEFVEWHYHQTERYELVNGYPVRMMTGARQGHNVAAANIIMSLGPQTRKRGCRTTGSDTAVRTRDGLGTRYPDVVVDCGPRDPDAFIGSEPTLVVEVHSKSTSMIDTTDKLEEYQAHPTIRTIVLVEPGRVDVKVYEREESGWSVARYHDLDATIALDSVGAHLPMRDIYMDLDPKPVPALDTI